MVEPKDGISFEAFAATLDEEGRGYTFTMPAANVIIRISTEPISDTYDITVEIIGEEGCDSYIVDPTEDVEPGTDIRVAGYAKEGWKLKSVTKVAETGVAIEDNNTKYGFYMPESDVTVTFEFVEINPSDGPEFVQQRLLLDGAIIIQFMVRLPENDGYVYDRVEFTIAGSPVEDWVSDRTVAYAEATYDESYGLYCFNYPVTSIQMADLVTATLYYTVDGEEQTLVKENYSAKQYFLDYDAYQSNPENPPITGVMKNAIEATADYGHFVQKYLESIRPWTIGESYDSADHLVMDKNYQSDDYTDEQISAAGTGLAAYEYTFTNECASIKSGTFSLSLESELGINVILKPVDGYTGKILVSIDGGEAVEIALQTSGNYAGRYLISLKNIKAHKLGVEHTFEAWTADDTTAKTTLTCSGLSYVNVLYTKLSNNEKAVNAAVAIYRYAMAANGAK